MVTESGEPALEVAAYLAAAKAQISEADFLSIPFNPATSAEDAQLFAALVPDQAAFRAWRENVARTAYHMQLDDYEAVFSRARDRVFALANTLDLTVTPHAESYEGLSRRCARALAARERAAKGKGGNKGTSSFVESHLALSAVQEAAHLFQGRSTLHSLIAQDALVYGVGTTISQAIDWIGSQIHRFKCPWCKTLISFARRAACIAAGTAVCGLLVTAMGGPLGVIASKFFCNFPLYLSRLFATWCEQAVRYITDRLRQSEDCMCSFTVPNLSIPATDFKVAGLSVFKSKAVSIGVGQLCTVKPGQCAGSTKEEQEKFDTNKAKSEAARAVKAAEEAERVKKMTLSQKIDYHRKIIAGEVQSNMTDKMIFDLLTSATGLGKSMGKAIIAGAGKLIHGDVKGAAAAVGAEAAKQLAKASVTATRNYVVSSAVSAGVTAVARTVVDRTAAAARIGVDNAANIAGAVVSTTARAVGNVGVSAHAAVLNATGNAKAAADARANGRAKVDAVANGLGNVVSTGSRVVGNLATTIAANAATQSAANKIGAPAGKNLVKALTKFEAKNSGKSAAGTRPGKASSAGDATATAGKFTRNSGGDDGSSDGDNSEGGNTDGSSAESEGGKSTDSKPAPDRSKTGGDSKAAGVGDIFKNAFNAQGAMRDLLRITRKEVEQNMTKPLLPVER